MLESITRVYRRGEARIMGACESIKIDIHIYVRICTMFVLATLTFHLLFRYTLATGIKFIAQKETSDRGRGGVARI